MALQQEQIPRIDTHSALYRRLLKYCRLKPGEIWTDPQSGHRVGCLDASSAPDIRELAGKKKAVLAVHDPPYNLVVGNGRSRQLGKTNAETYIRLCKKWIGNTLQVLKSNAHLYIWLGADQKEHFQPLPDFMMMMRDFKELSSRSFITMRNQRGYGTQKNWMAVRQELLYYTRGHPAFRIKAEYTDIPKILNGYYKEMDGRKTSNMDRSKSPTIRAGNVWVDIQQVFYRMQENVPGCYAQKPLKAIERIVKSGSDTGDVVMDFFAHSGTTLLAAEKLDRICYTLDLDPVFAEITIRRLEHFRKTGKTGWQFESPFPEAQ